MKTRAEVTPEKLRGGFYTPPGLVRVCVDRVASLLPDDGEIRILEPSAGDGAFVRGLAEGVLSSRIREVVGIEPVETEAIKFRHALEATRLHGTVLTTSAIVWGVGCRERFDAAVGNPPFVRFQFLTEEDRLCLPLAGERLGVSLSGVGNLWIPVLLTALSRLRAGGAAAFVIPTECLTGCSAGVVRDWLVANMDQLRLDLFPPGSFPDVLQEVLVLSGTRRETMASTGELLIVEYDVHGESRRLTHGVKRSSESWTRYLLTPRQLHALEEATNLPAVRRLGELATFEVSIVTGANSFFSASSKTVQQFGLDAWAKPLLPRVRYARGLVYTDDDHRQLRTSDAAAWLLHFSDDRPSPLDHRGPRDYLTYGETLGLPDRYKCRIRSPWYRVPHVREGRLLLSKRSHRYHRLILNEAGVLTTDTVYRGWMKAGAEPLERSLAAGFHNSLTLLSAELEGRSFGGGVLELVPSEIARLVVPSLPLLGNSVHELDAICRSITAEEELVERTDALLGRSAAGVPSRLLAELAEARGALLGRRMSRAARGVDGERENVDLAA